MNDDRALRHVQDQFVRRDIEYRELRDHYDNLVAALCLATLMVAIGMCFLVIGGLP